MQIQTTQSKYLWRILSHVVHVLLSMGAHLSLDSGQKVVTANDNTYVFIRPSWAANVIHMVL